MPAWTRGRVTLLGDACHPMLPFMAQGACMAIEDAATLGECLAADQDVGAALLRYEAARRSRTAAVQRKSRINKTLYHLNGAPARLRDLTLPRAAVVLSPHADLGCRIESGWLLPSYRRNF
jgi:salicylate hydroxylase